MKRLEGKVAVVTGGNSGIGLASAKRLQEEGARVAIAGRSKKTLDEAVKTIGNGVLAVQADVAKLADIDKLYAEVSKKFGKIDVLFVNAGVAKFAPFADTSESLFDEQFDINIKGAYFTIQKALPLLNDGARRRFHHFEYQRGGLDRDARNERLFGDKGRTALLGENYSCGTGGARHPREHGCAGANRHANLWENRTAERSLR